MLKGREGQEIPELKAALPQDPLVPGGGRGAGRPDTALPGPPRSHTRCQRRRRRLMEPHGPAGPGSVLLGEREYTGQGRGRHLGGHRWVREVTYEAGGVGTRETWEGKREVAGTRDTLGQ